ncbi:uncharacterized protein LOC121972881 [Zingiber officinale]|uniref:uncharacterized protein LOC121972881 n=1 Tax=Zingiber officinale TaxID=94328 RepID=UPI001C4BBD38|nr:uncharacterized protein LOC121972881 [Zingiber officinale]
MDLLEVLLDAVVPRLISVPCAVLAGGFSWAWAVAVTAAVFVLWIRAFGSRLFASTLSPPPPPPPPTMTTTVQSSSEDESKAASLPLRSDAASVANPLNRYLGEVSTSKRRFKTCYDGSSIGVTGTEEDDSEVDERWRTAPWEGDWRWDGLLAAERQRWDLGWYRCLDMAALDGSVVRLWDGGSGSPTTRRRTAQKSFFWVNCKMQM